MWEKKDFNFTKTCAKSLHIQGQTTDFVVFLFGHFKYKTLIKKHAQNNELCSAEKVDKILHDDGTYFLPPVIFPHRSSVICLDSSVSCIKPVIADVCVTLEEIPMRTV